MAKFTSPEDKVTELLTVINDRLKDKYLYVETYEPGDKHFNSPCYKVGYYSYGTKKTCDFTLVFDNAYDVTRFLEGYNTGLIAQGG